MEKEIYDIDNADLIWEDKEQLPQCWYEGAFHGNGILGSMCYFRIEGNRRFLHVELGNNMVYDRRPSRSFWMAKQFDNPRLPIGSLEYECSGEIEQYRMQTHLYDAYTELYIKTKKTELQCCFYVCAGAPLIVIEQEKGNMEKWQFIPAEAISPRQVYGITHNEPERTDKSYVHNEKPKVICSRTEIACIQSLACEYVTVTYGKIEENRLLFTISQDNNLTVESVKEELQRAVASAFQKIHKDWWNAYYHVSGLHIPDKKLQKFYWRQVYKLGSALRKNSPPLDNQGPWLDKTPWPGTWWNLNVQLCYWPLYTSNRLDQAESLNNFLKDHQAELIENVPEKYREDSSGIGTNTTWNMRSKIAEPGIDNGKQFVELGNLTWALHDCWLYYQMSQDKNVLAEVIYPILLRSINYYIHFLYKENGRWHLAPTESPEYGEICEDCNYDLALLKWGCQTLLESAEILGYDEKINKNKWKDIYDNLAEYPVDDTGYMIGKNLPYRKSHRHFSHLMMHIPLYLINRDNSDSWELVDRSICHWFSYKGDIQGFSYVGASMLCSAYGKGDRALEYLKQLLNRHISINTMYREAGPVMETPLAAMECLQQMALQSWGGKIRVFPAVPSEWKNLEFSKFAAQGGFIVSGKYENERTVEIEIFSRRSTRCTIETDMQEVWLIQREQKIEENINGYFSFDISKGETVKLMAR